MSRKVELIKKFWVVIAVVLPILIIVVIRSSGVNHFKSDAKRWAEPSISQANTITLEETKLLTGKNLIINLDKTISPIGDITGEVQNIPADSVLSKNHINSILKHNGGVLLFSSEPGLSARVWMLLSQMGCRNIYILTKDSDNEVFKYKFRPDTLLD